MYGSCVSYNKERATKPFTKYIVHIPMPSTSTCQDGSIVGLVCNLHKKCICESIIILAVQIMSCTVVRLFFVTSEVFETIALEVHLTI